MFDKPYTRRTALKSIGGGIGGFGLIQSSSLANAEDTSDTAPDLLEDASKSKVRKFLSEPYPDKEASFVANRWDHHRTRVLNNKKTRKEAFEDITQEIKNGTKQIAQDVAVGERHSEALNEVTHVDSAPGEFNVSASSTAIRCGGETDVSSAYHEDKEVGGTALTQARTLTDTEIEANSTSYGYANGYAWAERGGDYQSETDGKVNISVEYERSGVEDTADGAECNIMLYLQNIDTGDTEDYVLESGDTSSRTVCKGVTSSLPTKGKYMRVILRIDTSVSGIGGDIYADYYAGGRGVSVKNIYATPV